MGACSQKVISFFVYIRRSRDTEQALLAMWRHASLTKAHARAHCRTGYLDKVFLFSLDYFLSAKIKPCQWRVARSKPLTGLIFCRFLFNKRKKK